jgi:hypothetical protein
MFAGQFLTSKNGFFHALMEEDGNFVIYRGDLFKAKSPGYEKTARWRLFPDKGPGGGTGYHIYMQGDGNLVIYRQIRKPLCGTPKKLSITGKRMAAFWSSITTGGSISEVFGVPVPQARVAAIQNGRALNT